MFIIYFFLRNYEVDMTLFVERLNKSTYVLLIMYYIIHIFHVFFTFLKLFFILAISAFETGTSKKAATKKCSLSIINQLCGLGQIELCLSSQKKKEKLCFAHNVVVSVDKKLINKVLKVLEELKIKPMDIVSIYWLLLLT